ncbi:Hypothetical predicted protein [Olea europaea subsp. europaea]|uniref:Uncharacterized protein n=1 Tax=Olea europaea subsp. europaea TaxID=158383 RepID=A0A8S0P9H3_OLEEU|nr:Hypothetical predicted protein [Olea europaea subsp. europaea]
MEIAQAETASELSGLLSSKGSSGNLREVDLNETPNMQNKRFLTRPSQEQMALISVQDSLKYWIGLWRITCLIYSILRRVLQRSRESSGHALLNSEISSKGIQQGQIRASSLQIIFVFY